MNLGDILGPDNILPEMQAANRWEAIDELINNLVATGKIKAENREAIGAVVKIFHSASSALNGSTSQSRLVKGGSSYLSQSELPVTFGLGKRDRIERVVIEWPSGRTEEYKDLAAGRAYMCVEEKGITALPGF